MGSLVLAFLVGVGAAFGLPGELIAQQPPALPYVIDSVSAYTELQTGEPIRFLISVRDRVDHEDETLRPSPVEIRAVRGMAVITPVFRHVEANTFEAWVEFRQHGDWQFILYPHVPENQRAWLPTAVPTETMLRVDSGPTDWLGPFLVILLAAGIFAYLGPTDTRRNESR